MDSPDSPEMEFLRTLVTEYAETAKKILVEDDALEPVVLVGGKDVCFQVQTGPLPPALVHDVTRGLCASHPDLAHAAYVSIGHVLFVDSRLPAPEDISTQEGARLCIVVHASHRDAGMLAAHVPFERKGPKSFEFGATEWPDVRYLREPVLDNVWGKRRLNS